MKLLVFGSLNIDYTYRLTHLVREGETIESCNLEKSEGGKGLNQAVALAKATQEIYFAGMIGNEGDFLKAYLDSLGINTQYIYQYEGSNGHAIIQVDDDGRNSIILYGGSNQQITPRMIDDVLSNFHAGDYLLVQNEISNLDIIIKKAHEKGLIVVLNPSPITKSLLEIPSKYIDWYILNEIEGQEITGEQEPNKIIDTMLKNNPACRVVLTLGVQGSIYADINQTIRQPIFKTNAVDTTAAGDTFTGYFLQGILADKPITQALRQAAQASSLTVAKAGAGRSIPTMQQVQDKLNAAGE